MKRVMLITVLSLMFIGCSKDEPNDPLSDPIAYEFLLYSISRNGEVYEPEGCQREIAFDLNAFEHGFYTLYGDSPNGGCQETAKGTVQWKKSGDRYKIACSIPFLDGSGVPVKSSLAQVNGEELILNFEYDGDDIEIRYRRN